jgi:ribonuclease HI
MTYVGVNSMRKIQFDGAAVPNPGNIGIGVVLIENNSIIEKISQKLPDIGTNNIAEYTALLRGINKALELGWSNVIIEGDSMLVINQVNGKWKIHKDHLRILCSNVQKELLNFGSYQLNWIPREKNSIADELAVKAIGFTEDPYHNYNQRANFNQKNLKIKIDEPEITCPRCNNECIFSWHEFKNGTRHIRRECPVHGYIGHVPKNDFFTNLADKNSDKNQKNQKSISDY